MKIGRPEEMTYEHGAKMLEVVELSLETKGGGCPEEKHLLP